MKSPTVNPNEAGGNNNETMADVVKDMRSASNAMLLNTARDIVAEKVVDSALLGDTALEERIPKLDIRDLRIGRVIGRGGFCIVHEIKSFGSGMSIGTRESSGNMSLSRMVNPFRSGRSRGDRDASTAGGSVGTGSDWMSNVSGHMREEAQIVDTGSSAFQPIDKSKKYVVKRLSMDNMDKITFLKGTVDLAMETRFLAALDHINVIKMYGASSDGPFAAGFFIVLERMDETLTKRIKKWMDITRQCKGITGVFTGSRRKLKELETERMLSAFEIAKGTTHLHNKKIIFRDLKPDNIGYNSNGVLKLFDFGLARELKESEKHDSDTYKMTGFTGALRYSKSVHPPFQCWMDVQEQLLIFSSSFLLQWRLRLAYADLTI
jgi:serine/threonine protein kinase